MAGTSFALLSTRGTIRLQPLTGEFGSDDDKYLFFSAGKPVNCWPGECAYSNSRNNDYTYLIDVSDKLAIQSYQ